MEAIKIILLCVAAAVSYGVVHDQFTLRICLEYFTVGHPPIFGTLPDTLHAAAWGVVATWWMGLFLGVLAAGAARLGTEPRIAARTVLPWVGYLLCVMAACAIAAGAIGYFCARGGLVDVSPVFGANLPREKHDPFVADWFAHSASYLSGGVGGIAICVFVLVRRWWLSQVNRSNLEIVHG